MFCWCMKFETQEADGKKKEYLLLKLKKIVSHYDRKGVEVKKMSPCTENNLLFNKY